MNKPLDLSGTFVSFSKSQVAVTLSKPIKSSYTFACGNQGTAQNEGKLPLNLMLESNHRADHKISSKQQKDA